ncbi:MAG: ATP-binding protein [Flavobacteriales bacterium]|nr:ATP-binding protein [Flavobacteriales bacterium]
MQNENLYRIIEPHAPIGIKYFTFQFQKIPSSKFFKYKIETEVLKKLLTENFPGRPLYFIENGHFENNTGYLGYYENLQLMVILKDGLILEKSSNSLTFYYDDRIISAELDALKTVIENAEPNGLENRQFFMIKKSQFQEYELVDFRLKRTEIILTDYYNDDLTVMHENILSFLVEPDSNGLVLFHGAPGTGKTSYIRHLISSAQSRFIYVPNNLFTHLSDPEFISFISSFPDSVIVLEDCEELLRSRVQQTSDAGISNLLNLGDGLLGDALKLKIICTFNCELSRIDEAILRKGRLAFRYEFKLLTVEKCNRLFTLLGINTKTDETMSLAEIFNFEHNNQSDDLSRNSIGF